MIFCSGLRTTRGPRGFLGDFIEGDGASGCLRIDIGVDTVISLLGLMIGRENATPLRRGDSFRTWRTEEGDRFTCLRLERGIVFYILLILL